MKANLNDVITSYDASLLILKMILSTVRTLNFKRISVTIEDCFCCPLQALYKLKGWETKWSIPHAILCYNHR